MNSPLRLLLIDDDELDRLAIVRALKQSSIAFEITQSASAGAGLQLASEQHFDAVLLDYRLPDQDGIDVLRTLRSGRFEGVAVIMVSRYEDDEIAEHCLEAGAQSFLLKDEVSASRLTRAVRQAKQRYQMEEALKASREQLRILSERDPLTGLANRRGFEVALESSIARAQRGHGGLGLLLLDLDDFKSVNDTLGHDAGDKLLVEIARRLRETVRDGDFLCRLGGDEFVILATDLQRDDQAALLADRIIAVLREPIEIDASEQIVTTSIGIAILDVSSNNVADLLKCADMAMYRAKHDGRNQSRFYSETLQDAVQSRATIKRDMYKALEREEFKVYYQAKIKASDGTLFGMEALLRWHHPRLGILTPASFIANAEETGLIIDIGDWVLRESCRQLGAWQLQLPSRSDQLTLAVNLSALQLREHALLNVVENALENYRLDPTRLELEITESALIEDPSRTVGMLNSLAALGVTLSLDDFGTGYSSLQHLKLFPISVLKIDMEFISTIGHSINDDRLLVAMIRFAQALDLKVVAEGVETKEQTVFCGQNGCDLLQGYYFSRPIAAEEFETAFLLPEHAYRSCQARRMDMAAADSPGLDQHKQLIQLNKAVGSGLPVQLE